MAKNLSKKFALLVCCLMTMQALRLVISTAGFCVVRFHIDCELFNIFISRLVNAVMMSQLFGNWLGDLIVFAANGVWKLHAIALANWAELICFFAGLASICAGEQGHLTGFYWSMVGAYFWWKVGEAPCTSVGGTVVDWYFAGFTLSGVWAAMLKSVMMMFIVQEKGVHSDVLGEVNVKVVGDVSIVGARSVKTTVDYRAARSLFAATIAVTALMCLLWDVISESVDNEGSQSALDKIKNAANTGASEASPTNNKLLSAIKEGAHSQTVDVVGTGQPAKLTFDTATVRAGGVNAEGDGEIDISVTKVKGVGSGQSINSGGAETKTTAKKVKTELEKLIGEGKIAKVELLSENVQASDFTLKVKVFLAIGRKWIIEELQAAAGGANKLQEKIRDATDVKVDGQQVTLTGATVAAEGVKAKDGDDKIQIVVGGVTVTRTGTVTDSAQALKNALDGLIGTDKIQRVTGTGDTSGKLTLEVELAPEVKNTGKDWAAGLLKAAAGEKPATATDNRLVVAFKAMGKSNTVDVTASGQTAQLDFANAEVDPSSGVVKGAGNSQIVITVGNVTGAKEVNLNKTDDVTKQTLRQKVQARVKTQLEEVINVTAIDDVSVAAGTQTLTITVTAGAKGKVEGGGRKAVASATGLSVGGIFAVPGALMFAGFAKWCKKTAAPGTLRVWAICGALVGGMAAAAALLGVTLAGASVDQEDWVSWDKWVTPEQDTTTWAAMIGLVAGLSTGALVGLCIGACKGSKKRGLAAGAFYGSFFGLWIGEICNAAVTWQKNPNNFLGKPNKAAVVVLGIIIVVGGLGTVYSIYPGMAPCSITQFKYFNIIGISILILSVIAPIVIMVLDLAELDERLAWTILNAEGDDDITSANGRWMWAAVGSGLVMLIATLICEAIVISVLQHPFSKTAQKVTTSPWRACTLTIMMVSFQLTSTGIGFGCVGAGSGLNVGVMNLNSTLVLWTVETCAVLGEGYLTELKKYEPGKWPTQGMGKWATYGWWNGKAFSNAWQIWCCICTTDLRRDMLCKQ